MSDTKERILKAAEKMFLAHGINGSSLRAITSKAKVNLAAINYHFGSKENLIRAVTSRIVAPIDQITAGLLEKARAQKGGKNLDVKDYVQAYIAPWLKFRTEFPEFFKLFNQFYSYSEKASTPFRDLVLEAGKKAYNDFSHAIMEILPDVPEEILYNRINISTLTAFSTIINSQLVEALENMSNHKLHDQVLIDHLVSLIETGYEKENTL